MFYSEACVREHRHFVINTRSKFMTNKTHLVPRLCPTLPFQFTTPANPVIRTRFNRFNQSVWDGHCIEIDFSRCIGKVLTRWHLFTASSRATTVCVCGKFETPIQRHVTHSHTFSRQAFAVACIYGLISVRNMAAYAVIHIHTIYTIRMCHVRLYVSAYILLVHIHT